MPNDYYFMVFKLGKFFDRYWLLLNGPRSVLGSFLGYNLKTHYVRIKFY